MSKPRTTRKKKKGPKSKRPSGRSGWTAAERYWDRVAAKEGVKPVDDVADLAVLSPEDGEELLEAIREMREADRLARQNKEERQRAPKRA